MKLKSRLIIIFSFSFILFLIAFNFVLTRDINPADTYSVHGSLHTKIAYSGSRSRSIRIQLNEDPNTYTINSIQTKEIHAARLINECSVGDPIQLIVRKKNSLIYNLISNKKVIVGLIFHDEKYLDLKNYNARERRNNITGFIIFFIIGLSALIIGIFEYRYSKKPLPHNI